MRNKLPEDAVLIYDGLSETLQQYVDWLLAFDFEIGLEYLRETAK